MNKKIIAIIMTAVMLFPTTTITALASNSGLEVQGSNSSIITTTDEVEAGSYTIVEDSTVVEETEDKVTVDSKNDGTQITEEPTDTQTEIQSDAQSRDALSNTTTTENSQVNQDTNTGTTTQEANTTTGTTQITGDGLETTTSQTVIVPKLSSVFNSLASSGTSAKVTKPKGPKAVKSLKFKANNYNTITLSWKASRGATKYIIYRSTSETGKYKKVKTTKSTTYKQSKLSCGKTYYYKVVPYKGSVVGSEKIIKVKTKPVKVTKLKATVNKTTIKLTWKKGKGASSYDVFRSTNKSTGFQKVGDTTKTKYYDKNLESGKTYYYRVYSVSNGTKGSRVTCKAKVTYKPPSTQPSTEPSTDVTTPSEMRAAWISYLDYATLKNKSKSEFTKNMNAIYDNVVSQNVNTVIVHVRAFSDAVYPSSYYKWANFITSDADGPDYDPLAIMVEEAHKKGLLFHAWINPYRTADGGRVNPASTSAVNKIIGGVEEIVTNYNVDGIHFDDYFYLSTDSTSQSDKMTNVNRMVKGVYAKIKSIKPNVVFGISPAGNVEYAKSIGCDVDTWLSSSGYIDYICPQLYWSDDYITKSGATTKMFTNTMKQWTSLNKNNTSMYAGLALYKAGVAVETAWGSDYGWGNSTSNLYEQYKAAKSAGYDGYSLYRYGSFSSPAGKAELANLKKLSQ